MKKKILLALITVALVIVVACLPVAAAFGNNYLTVSEDYRTVEYKGETYERIDSADLTYGHNDSYGIYNISLTDTQDEEIQNIYATQYGVYIELTLDYVKGGSIDYLYVSSAHLDEFEDFMEHGGEIYECLNYGNILFSTDEKTLKAYPVTMKGYEVEYYSYLAEVRTCSADGSFIRYAGYVCTDLEGAFYYVDIYDFGVDAAYGFSPSDYERVTVYKITDEVILAGLTDDGTGDFEDLWSDEDSKTAALILAIFCWLVLALILGLVPLAAFIICLIFSFKKKKPYSTILRIIAITLACELIVFTLTSILLFVLVII